MKPTGEYQGKPSSPDSVKFKTEFQGLPISIDRPKGFVMKGVGKDGKPWSREYHLDYGFIPKTRGGDGDELDVFLGPKKDAQDAFWAVQKKEDGSFDEFKVFLGFDSRSEAEKAYVQHVPRRFLKRMFSMRVEMMKGMLGLEPSVKTAMAFHFLEELTRSL